MSFAVVIPARWGSTRFPGKILAPLNGKPVVQWVWENAVRSKVGRVIIATDDKRIEKAARAFGAETVMTPSSLPSGTDRVHRASLKLKARWILNVQGDEPLMRPAVMRKVAELLRRNPKAEMATAAVPLKDPAKVKDPNVVKVVTGKGAKALYFSRSPIPHDRDAKRGRGPLYLQHLGIYGYQRRALSAFVRLPESRLERSERLEQLRALENGFTILVAPAPEATIAVDTPGDMAKAARALRRAGAPRGPHHKES